MQSKEGTSFSSMLAEQIQNIIADVMKAQLGGDSYKTHLSTKPHRKSINALHMRHSYQPPKF